MCYRRYSRGWLGLSGDVVTPPARHFLVLELGELDDQAVEGFRYLDLAGEA